MNSPLCPKCLQPLDTSLTSCNRCGWGYITVKINKKDYQTDYGTMKLCNKDNCNFPNSKGCHWCGA